MKDACIPCLKVTVKHQRAKYPTLTNVPTDSDHHHNQCWLRQAGTGRRKVPKPSRAVEPVQPRHAQWNAMPLFCPWLQESLFQSLSSIWSLHVGSLTKGWCWRKVEEFLEQVPLLCGNTTPCFYQHTRSFAGSAPMDLMELCQGLVCSCSMSSNSALWGGMLPMLLWTAWVFSICGRLFQRVGWSVFKMFSCNKTLLVSVVDGKLVKQKHFLLPTFFLKFHWKAEIKFPLFTVFSFVLFLVYIQWHSSYCL